MKWFLSLVCIVLCAGVSFAQRGYELGGMVGTAHYLGDLNPNFSLSDPGPGISLLGRYNMNSRLSVKLSLNYARVRGDDANSPNSFNRARNLSFMSNVYDGTFQFEFNFFPLIHGSNEYFFTPYIFGGLSAFYFNPKAKYEGEWVELQPLGTEGQYDGQEYSKFQPALAYGIGLKYDLNDRWSLNVELSGRRLFTDYLDDVSTTYPNMLELRSLRGEMSEILSDRSGEISDVRIGEEGRQRGNRRNDDSYNFITIGVVYFLGIIDCPPISKPKARFKKREKRSTKSPKF